jgi:hypothetical protein
MSTRKSTSFPAIKMRETPSAHDAMSSTFFHFSRCNIIFHLFDDDNGVTSKNRQWKVWGAIRCLLFFLS